MHACTCRVAWLVDDVYMHVHAEWHGWWMVCAGVLVGVLALYLALATPTPDQLLHWDSIITTEEGR